MKLSTLSLSSALRVTLAVVATATLGLTLAPATPANAATPVAVQSSVDGGAYTSAKVVGANVEVDLKQSLFANMKSKATKTVKVSLKNSGANAITITDRGIGITVLPGTAVAADRGIVINRLGSTVLKPGATAVATVSVTAPKAGTTNTGLKVELDYVAK